MAAYIFVVHQRTIFIFRMIQSLPVMFLDKTDLYLTFKFRMGTANTQIKAFFMHLNHNIKITLV